MSLVPDAFVVPLGFEGPGLGANLADLVRLAKDFEDRSGFTYSMLDGDEVIGCGYIYPSQTADAAVSPWVRFRPLAESDLPTLVGWFAEPDIAMWWNQPAEISSIRIKYLPRIEQREPTRMWIAEIDGVDAGLLQSYMHVDYPDHDDCVGILSAVGIDYLIAGRTGDKGLAVMFFVRSGPGACRCIPRRRVVLRPLRRRTRHRGVRSNTPGSLGSASASHPTSPWRSSMRSSATDQPHGGSRWLIQVSVAA